MKFTFIILIISMVTGIGDNGCSARSDSGNMLFTFNDVTYQAWAVTENERGTDVTIILVDVDPGVTFISVTFRGIEVPVFVEKARDKTILRARLITGESVLENYQYTVTNEEDNLKYSFGSKEYTYPVKKFRRLPTRIK